MTVKVDTALKRLLRERNWSVMELAQRADLNPIQVRRYVSGRQCPMLPTARKLAKVLEVSVVMILGETTDRRFRDAREVAAEQVAAPVIPPVEPIRVPGQELVIPSWGVRK